MKKNELHELASLVDLILNSDASDIKALGYKRIPPQPNLTGSHSCGVSPAWFSTNSSILVNQLLKTENVPEAKHSIYFASVDEFFSIHVESKDNITLRRKLLHDYLKKKWDEGYNMNILSLVGQIICFLQRERRRLFSSSWR